MGSDRLVDGAHSPLEAALKRLHGTEVVVTVRAEAVDAPSAVVVTNEMGDAMHEWLLKKKRQQGDLRLT